MSSPSSSAAAASSASPSNSTNREDLGNKLGPLLLIDPSKLLNNDPAAPTKSAAPSFSFLQLTSRRRNQKKNRLRRKKENMNRCAQNDNSHEQNAYQSNAAEFRFAQTQSVGDSNNDDQEDYQTAIQVQDSTDPSLHDPQQQSKNNENDDDDDDDDDDDNNETGAASFGNTHENFEQKLFDRIRAFQQERIKGYKDALDDINESSKHTNDDDDDGTSKPRQHNYPISNKMVSMMLPSTTAPYVKLFLEHATAVYRDENLRQNLDQQILHSKALAKTFIRPKLISTIFEDLKNTKQEGMNREYKKLFAEEVLADAALCQLDLSDDGGKTVETWCGGVTGPCRLEFEKDLRKCTIHYSHPHFIDHGTLAKKLIQLLNVKSVELVNDEGLPVESAAAPASSSGQRSNNEDFA